jgi:hypothetical protein
MQCCTCQRSQLFPIWQQVSQTYVYSLTVVVAYCTAVECTVVVNNALCCTRFHYTSPPLTIGATPQQSVNNLIAWLDTILLESPVVRSHYHDGSLSTIYEGIPEGKFQRMMQKLSTTQTTRLFVACKHANISAGWCWSIHANRGVVKAYHLCMGPFINNTG